MFFPCCSVVSSRRSVFSPPTRDSSVPAREPPSSWWSRDSIDEASGSQHVPLTCDLCVERTPIYHTVRTNFPHVLCHLSSTAVSVALLVSIQHIHIYIKYSTEGTPLQPFFYISPWILHELYRIPVSLFRFSSFTDSDVKRTNNNKKKTLRARRADAELGLSSGP